jgi:nickel/cobalt transporter (NicO) family protein
MRGLFASVVLAVAVTAPAAAHDIPNAQVDRSIQAKMVPGRLTIDYEVSLAELTLVQDLRGLIGELPDDDRRALFDRYGQVTGPLNAKGFLVSVDGRPLTLRFLGFEVAVEEHPRYTFRFETALPERGRLSIRDTNYIASEGTSRLALKSEGLEVRGDDLPPLVQQIPVRPVWQLTDAEERRTKQIDVDFGPAMSPATAAGVAVVAPMASSRTARVAVTSPRLARLLDRAQALPLVLLLLTAFMLGAAHAIQPGHGKTLVAAATLGDRGGWSRGIALAVVITAAHMSSVLVIALVLWATRTTRYADINRTLAQVAGFTIAAIGFWRLGRHLANFPEHTPDTLRDSDLGSRGIFSLGLAGGLVPCWDAIVLIILAEAVGRLALGLLLLLAFSLGMAVVLVLVGVLAAQLRSVALRAGHADTWERALGLVSSIALAAIGLYLLAI